MYAAYTLALTFALVLAAPWYLWRGRGTGKYSVSFRERLGRIPVDLNPSRRPSIWIHAVSVGEALAIRPLLEPLRARRPDLALIVSTTTVAGNALARKSLAADGVFFAPFDLPRPVGRALDVVRPKLLVLVETEIWPNLIHGARHRDARVAIVNGRLSEASFQGYKRAGWFIRRVLQEIDLFLMQGEDHAQRMRDLGAPAERVHVLGNLKFDAIGATSLSPDLARLFEGAPGRPVVVAGSTMPGEEEMVLRGFRRVVERFPEAGLILAPRHPERFGQIPALIEAAGFRCLRRTALEPGGWRNGSVVLLDTIGELAQIYSLASVAFVGGSLVSTGGHNILEPAVVGKAVIVGPHTNNFREIVTEFRAAEAVVEVDSEEQLASAVVALLEDDRRRDLLGTRARGLVERSRGAVERTADALAGLVA